MWVTKLLISPVQKGFFAQKRPKLAFLVNLGQAMQAYSMPCCGSVGGCGARAVSRKTPIYFMMMMVMARMINLITIGLKRTELERLSKKKTASEEKEKSFRILYQGKFCENLCGSVGG